jgi:hypothetical protein
MCAGGREGDSACAFVNLWRPFDQVLVAHFKRSYNEWGNWASKIKSSPDRRVRGEIIVGREDKVYETCAWVSQAQTEIIVAATTTSQDVKSKWNKARQGSRKLLLQVHEYKGDVFL